jgi:hypothetical protein
VLAIPDMGLDTTLHIQSIIDTPLGADVQQQFEPSIVVGGFIDCRCVVDGVVVMY